MAATSIPRDKVMGDDRADNHKQINGKQDGNGQNKNRQNNNLHEDSRAANKTNGSKSTTAKRKIYYPTGDGKPMAEDELRLDQMNYTIPALRYRFRSRPDVYVAGNNFLYYQKDNPQARVSPDCYVAFGVAAKGHRRFYKVWEENDIAPAVVFEFTSKKTKKDDVTIKKPLYEQVLRVQEYFQFDPSGDYLKPRLQGQRLQNGVYQPIALMDNRMVSEQLGLELVIEGETLRFYDPLRRKWLRTYEEAETDALRVEAMEAELARMRAEMEALRQQK